MTMLRKSLLLGAAILAIGAYAQTAMAGDHAAMAEKTVMVGGAAMYPSKTIVENAVNSADHTTLVAALKAADLVETLKGKGPFTVFAPTNAGFEKLPEGTVDTLLKPENKAKLAGILTYHVVSGHMTAADIEANAKAHDGKATLKTVQGEDIALTKDRDGKWRVGVV